MLIKFRLRGRDVAPMPLPAAGRSRQEVKEVYDTPLMELVFKAATVHRMYHDPRMARAQAVAWRK